MAMEAGVPLMITIPKGARDRLREIAARRNLQNLDEVATASGIGREIICDFLSKLEEDRARADGTT